MNSTLFIPKNTFTDGIEGPACDTDGFLYAVNLKEKGDIARVSPAGEVSIFITLPKGSIGNGIRFNSRGEMIVADYTGHNVLLINMKTKKVVSFCHTPKMNQPNDLAVMENDILFCSDPNWNNNSGNIWRVDTSGRSYKLESGMNTTNGIEVAPGDKILYVNESNSRSIWAYDLSLLGEVSNKRLFHQFDTHGMDGMRCDCKGNLYITRFEKGTVVVLSPDGSLFQEIPLTGSCPTNICFGGSDGKTAYVTIAGDHKGIDTFRVEHPGRSWQLMKESSH